MWRRVRFTGNPGLLRPSDPSHCWYQFLAAQTLKIASMNGLGELDKLESELEDEINYESQAPPSETIQKARRKVEHLLHSKPVLLFVVVLNIVDCLLVLGELTFDFNHVGNIIKSNELISDAFLHTLEEQYPHDLHGVSDYPVEDIYDKIIHAYIFWGGINESKSMCFANETDSNSSHTPLSRHRRAAGGGGHGDGGHTIEEELGHGFHLTSVAILSLLVFITALKIAATVPRFFKSKMQVFDAVVILISFIIDLVFIEGVMSMDVSNYVIVLTFLLPWRIIRILNSLIVAVLDKQRFQMKLLFKQKKKIDKQYQEAHEKNKHLLKQLEALKGLCTDKGVTPAELSKVVDMAQGHKMSKLRALGKLAFSTSDSLSPKANGHPPVFTPSPTKNGAPPSFSESRRHSCSTPNLPIINEAHVNIENETSKL